MTLAIAAVLSAVAAPNLSRWQRSASRSAAVNDFMHAIFLARSEAIKRNGIVGLCPSENGIDCADRDDWHSGWLVFVNLDGDRPPKVDGDEPVVFRRAAWAGGRVTSNRPSFSFRPTAQVDVNGTIEFCDLRGTSDDARAIIISHTGRPRVSKRDANNQPVDCL